MTSLRYTKTAIVLHWLMAILILANLALGIAQDELPLSMTKIRMINWHKWIGVTVLILAAARLLWRLSHRPPQFTDRVRPWEKTLAKWVHGALYLLFFAIPLSGWLMSSAKGYPVVYLGLFPLPDLIPKQGSAIAEQWETVHAWLAYALLLLVVLHVAGAVKHQLQDRQGFLFRMGVGRHRHKETS